MNDYLASAEKIAKIIDRKVATKELRLLEVRRELLDLQQIGKLPDKSKLWEFMHEKYGYKGMKSKEKSEMMKEFYP